jgi:hypothetical protein
MGKKEDMRAAFEQAKVEKAQRGLSDDELEKFGRLVLDEICAGKSVRVYERGYVRVSGVVLGKKSASFEKLKGVSSTSDVTKKSGLGRAVGAAATLGANLVFSPNKRGDMYLTITTDLNTHMIHMSPPTESDLKAMHKIAATCESLLNSSTPNVEMAEPEAVVTANTNSTSSLSEEIMKLSQLRDSGLLSEDEFNAAKAKLLS